MAIHSIQIHLPSSIYRRLVEYCRHHGITIDAAIHRLCQQALDRQEPVRRDKQTSELHRVLDDARLVALLQRQGVDTVPKLLEWVQAERIQQLDGVGPATERKLVKALKGAGLL